MSIKGWRGMLIAAVLGAGLWAGIVGVVLCAVSDDTNGETVVPCPTDSTPCGTGVSPTMVQVPCPSEDSCSVEYKGGAWHIERTTP